MKDDKDKDKQIEMALRKYAYHYASFEKEMNRNHIQVKNYS